MTAPRVALLGTSANVTNVELVAAWRARGVDCELVEGVPALDGGHDVVLGRLDVLPTLDGVEPGLLGLLWLERRGAHVRNTARALLRMHDKLRTAATLARAGLPHPRTTHLRPDRVGVLPAGPVVLKPRFGSWGRDVRLCERPEDIAASLDEFAGRRWFRRHGVLVQEAVPSSGFDLRLIVAGGSVVGAIERRAAAGEWRTNVSVGGSKHAAAPDREARVLAAAAAAAVGADLVGVDLLPLPQGGYTVIELNGAVDFDETYGTDDVYCAVARALGLAPSSVVVRGTLRRSPERAAATPGDRRWSAPPLRGAR